MSGLTDGGRGELPTLMPDQLDARMRVCPINTNREQALCTTLRLALDPWRRLRGLLGTAKLESGDGLLIAPCRSIHTCFMRYPIDVLFLDRYGIVVALRSELGPWRFTPIFHAAYGVLELAAGTAARTGTVCGHRVAFQAVE